MGRACFIDRLLEESWKKAGVKPARPASDEEYLRRAYLDVLGRIPNVQEARAFLQTKESDKREKLVEYLLDHADYPKNFATQWTVLLIGRGNQGRMVDRGCTCGWLRKQFAAQPAVERGGLTIWSRPRARTRRTARSTTLWLTSKLARCR